jgi:hypothetical protein
MPEAIEPADLLAAASRIGGVCVLDLDGHGEVTLDPDHVMQTASAFKTAVALEVYCQVSAGELDPDERRRFEAERAPLRDGTVEQAVDLMLRLSDNVVANVLLHRVTRDRIMTRLSSLGLTHMTVSHDVPAEVAAITARLDKLARAAGFTGWLELSYRVYAGQYEQIRDRLATIAVDELALPHEQLGPSTGRVAGSPSPSYEGSPLIDLIQQRRQNLVSLALSLTLGAAALAHRLPQPDVLSGDGVNARVDLDARRATR